MNFLGKILVVLILIMSIIFMSLAMAMYATHRNWKKEADSLQIEVNEANARNRELDAELKELDGELAAEQASYIQQLQKLESERQQLTVQRNEMQERLTQLVGQNRELTGTVGATQQRLTALVEEVNELRANIIAAQQKRDESFVMVVEKTDELHQLRGDLTRATERNQQLIEQVSRYTQLMTENDLDPNAPPKGDPPKVGGKVTQVRKNDLIEVSLGSDDGLRPGHTIEVYRGANYIGRAEVLETAPDKAVGKMLKQFRRSIVQEGDRVATRLKVS